MKPFTLIGASGFVGTRLIEQIGSDNCTNIDKNISVKYPEITIIKDIRAKDFADSLPSSSNTIILLAAEHSDDVDPTSLYYDVNVEGTKNVLDSLEKKGIKNIVFTSSVAIYGLNKNNPDELYPPDTFNHYGKSKWLAEELLRAWYQKEPNNRSLTIIRPSVIFGEDNRGNVYNLLNQIASGKFIMVGNGLNKKSIAYVGNVAAFIHHCIKTQKPGYRLFNYTDKPDLNMNELARQVEICLNKKLSSIRLPFWFGYLVGMGFDLLSRINKRKYPISSIRVKKFCATTQFNTDAAHSSGFIPPFTIIQALHRTIKYESFCSEKD